MSASQILLSSAVEIARAVREGRVTATAVTEADSSAVEVSSSGRKRRMKVSSASYLLRGL